MSASLGEVFWTKVLVGSDNECWPWVGTRDPKGYGAINRQGRRLKAHRVSHELNIGPLPPELLVCHRCDNPPCVNPAHLYSGTAADNAADREARGRGRRDHQLLVRWRAEHGTSAGESHPNARLTNEQVLEIRVLCAAKAMTQKAIAARFGVAQGLVSMIHTRKVWRHL